MKLLTLALIITLLAAPGSLWAVNILITGEEDRVDVGLGAWIDGTVANHQSTFAFKYLSVGDEELAVSDVMFGSVSVDPGTGSIVLLYDSQETGGDPGLIIERLEIYTAPAEEPTSLTLRWSLSPADQLELTGGTDSPLGNGADMALHLPLELFAGVADDDLFILQTYQAHADNGSDQWVSPTGPTIGGTTVIPEPRTALLLLMGITFIATRRRRDEIS